ncbi:hypothetical protein MOMA_04545 [Moraxella macacae 0408225]|uniref:Uncharacterized protein n=1 Tax=Moraxella macacae 0408225 TaxID=1230338 RepID=L2F9T3_9GAMM|nr:hypothetical protein [Moraxella macacae]ELA09645.1 hypothetical protein MOMA_04545 [Moraxella macacae 0408225]
MYLENLTEQQYTLNPIVNPIVEIPNNHSNLQSDFEYINELAQVSTTVKLQKNPNSGQLLLSLSYQISPNTISPNNKINLAKFDKNLVKPTDFLWQQTCLECFIQIDRQQYFEINASPNGAYALYHFDDYRTPSHLPPRQTQALGFFWQNTTKPTAATKSETFAFLLALPTDLLPKKINPTAILYQTIRGEEHAVFYALNHANPPDFHNKAFWLDF